MQPKKRSLAWLRFRRWLGLLAVFAVVIPTVAVLLVRSSNVHGRLRTLAVEALRRELGVDAALGRIHISIVPLTLVAEEIALTHPEHGLLASADALRVQPSIAGLLHGRVEIASIELVRAHARLVVDRTGVRNLPELHIESGDGGPPTLPFRTFRLEDTRIELDAGDDGRAELTGVTAEVRGEPGHVIVVEGHADGGEVQRAGRQHPLRRLHVQAAIAPDSVRVDQAQLDLGPLELGISDASLPLPPPSTITGWRTAHGHLHVGADLGAIASLELPFALPRFAGHVAVDGDVAPGADAPSLRGVLVGDHVRVEQFGIGDRAELPFVVTPERVAIEGARVDVEGGGGWVGIDGTLLLTPDLPVRVVASPHGLSFGRLMSQFDVSPNSLVEWIFDGELRLAGSLAHPETIDLSGPVDLRTRDFVVTKDGFLTRPVRPVIAIPRGHFVGRWSIRPDGVRFSGLDAELPRSRIHADVLLGFHNELRVEATAMADLADVSPLDGFALAGQGTATCTIDGVFQDPHVRGHVRLADFVFDTFRLGDIDTDYELDRDGQAATLPRAVATKRDSRYVGEGIYLNFRDGRFAIRGALALERMTLADFYHVFGFEADERFTPYQGTVSGSATLSYTNGYPGDSPAGTLRTQLDLSVQTATLNGYGFEDGRFRGTWDWFDWSQSYRGGVLVVDHAELRKGRGVVTVSGSMQRGGVLSMVAVGDRIDLRDLEGIGDRFASIEGIAGVVARVHGTAERMLVDADVSVSDTAYAEQALGGGRLFVRLTYADDPWVVEARDWPRDVPQDAPCAHARRGLALASWPEDPPIQTIDGPMRALEQPSAFIVCGHLLDGAVRVDLALGRQSLYPIRGKLHLDDLELTRFVPSLATRSLTDAPTTGLVRGVLRFDDGGLRDPGSLVGRAQLHTFALERGAVRLENTAPLEVAFDRGTARVLRAQLRGTGVSIALRGSASLDTGLSLAVDADLRLSTLAELSSTLRDADGDLRVRLSATGPFSDPAIYGTAEVRNGSLSVDGLATPLRDLEALATFSERRVSIDHVSAAVAGGHVRVAGEANLDRGALRDARLTIDGDELSFAPTDGVALRMNTAAVLLWAQGDSLPRVTGAIDVLEASYQRDVALGTTLQELSRTQRTVVDSYDPASDFVEFDLTIATRQPIAVQNNLVDAQLVIEDRERPFRLVGTNQRYGVVGDMRFPRGRVFFRNTAFDLRRESFIAFDDETSIDPRFDVRATTEIRRSADLQAPSWRISLEAAGTTDALTITTRSDPDLPQEDILLLLAIGLTRSELETLRGGDLGSTLAIEALASVTGLDREIQRAVPVIDDFRLSSAYSVRTGRTEPQVSIGKRIADRIRLSATTGLSESREFRAVIEAQLDETTSVQAGYDNYNLTSASSFGNVGVDLRYRLEFE